MACIKKIKTIKNLGIYNDFRWPSDLKDFKRYNVLYGWNGTGKTTLSKLFEAMQTGNHPDYPNLQYSIEDSDAKTFNQDLPFSTKIKVFNTEFITTNVNFDSQSSKTISVYLGKENQETIDAIRKDEKLLEARQEEIRINRKELKTCEKERDKIFTDIARTISQGTQRAIVRNYTKRTAIEKYSKLTNSDHAIGEEELIKLTKSVSQSVMEPIPEVHINVTNLDIINNTINELLNKTITSVTISRLKENTDISEWVEEGLHLHEKYSNDTCEFCGQPITEERISQLLQHFNEADAQIKHEIDDLLAIMRNIYLDISRLDLADQARFYQELRSEYAEIKTKATNEIQCILENIKKIGEVITSKKAKTTEAVKNNVGNLDISKLLGLINKINLIIDSHNKKTTNFTKQIEADGKKIETHYLCEIRPEVLEKDRQIKELQSKIDNLINGNQEENIPGTKDLEQRIATNKSKISSTQKACDTLNSSLRTFLGHSEISFGMNSKNDGYNILRHGSPAKSLSEGERTAIAFVYFITTLQEEDFNIRESIILIDDPISSLDANSQFQAFSFLKNATKDAGQLFLFTHNFDFLKLLLNWLKNAFNGKSAFFMVKNIYHNDQHRREATLDKLDPDLENFENEYLYLFNILKNFKSDGTIENVYHIPNIMRKLLENFLMICVPKPETTYKRLELIDFDDIKKTAIYKFTNDESHITGKGFDPSLVQEAPKCIEYLFEMMNAVFPSHYKYLMGGETIN